MLTPMKPTAPTSTDRAEFAFDLKGGDRILWGRHGAEVEVFDAVPSRCGRMVTVKIIEGGAINGYRVAATCRVPVVVS